MTAPLPCFWWHRYKQLEADGDEDNDELVEKVSELAHMSCSSVPFVDMSKTSNSRFAAIFQAADKDRAWDDWKDNNPKGWGNKMGKRF
jgi:hypothetical protein